VSAPTAAGSVEVPTLGESLLARLAAHGVRHVFGIPGVHNVELYRGFSSTPGVRHITPRHEQGAGFMADGYARATGRPGVCFVISGPGLTNVSTAMAQARADSIPMLVLSTCQPPGRRGTGNGYLHELLDQQALASHFAVRSTTARSAQEVAGLLDEAFERFACGRPGPVHIDIPTTFLGERIAIAPYAGVHAAARGPAPDAIAKAAGILQGARRPIILAGGGARAAQRELTHLARHLQAPVCLTNNARGLLAPGDPLAVSFSASLPAVRRLIDAADAVVAVGTEIGQTDYDMYDDGNFRILAPLVRIDIDEAQAQRNAEPAVAILSDAAAALAALRAACPARAGNELLALLASVRVDAARDLPRRYGPLCALLEALRDAVPGIVMVGDSTQVSYAGSLAFAAAGPGEWFTSSTGYGTLGHALPAAIGAQLGFASRGEARTVLAIVGDGGLQFTLAELGSARDAGVPLIVLLWNNHGYGEIKAYMRSRGIVPEGVDILAPDFSLLARSYGWSWTRADRAAGIVRAVADAAHRAGSPGAGAAPVPTIIEVDEGSFFQ
jgi:acetolactate synthase-1/2/3 large subunit